MTACCPVGFADASTEEETPTPQTPAYELQTQENPWYLMATILMKSIQLHDIL